MYIYVCVCACVSVYVRSNLSWLWREGLCVCVCVWRYTRAHTCIHTHEEHTETLLHNLYTHARRNLSQRCCVCTARLRCMYQTTTEYLTSRWSKHVPTYLHTWNRLRSKKKNHQVAEFSSSFLAMLFFIFLSQKQCDESRHYSDMAAWKSRTKSAFMHWWWSRVWCTVPLVSAARFFLDVALFSCTSAISRHDSSHALRLLSRSTSAKIFKQSVVLWTSGAYVGNLAVCEKRECNHEFVCTWVLSGKWFSVLPRQCCSTNCALTRSAPSVELWLIATGASAVGRDDAADFLTSPPCSIYCCAQCMDSVNGYTWEKAISVDGECVTQRFHAVGPQRVKAMA